MSIFLKIKIKSLAEEARIIRFEERHQGSPDRRSDLRNHRIGVVRRESRHTLLAYGYLRGTPYRRIESKSKSDPDWGAVERMIKKYGPPKHNVSFEDWRKEDEQRPSICSAAA